MADPQDCACSHVLHRGVEIIGIHNADDPKNLFVAWNCQYKTTHLTPVCEAEQWAKDVAIDRYVAGMRAGL